MPARLLKRPENDLYNYRNEKQMLYEPDAGHSGYFTPVWLYDWLIPNGGITSSGNLNIKAHRFLVYYVRS